MRTKMGRHTEELFTEQELSTAAGLVRQSMLNALPEPEACSHEFSAQFHEKMDRLLTRDRALTAMATVRRWTAAIILMILFGAATVLAVDTEARASFFDWVRKLYENSLVYEFFGAAPDEGLPSYELGWVPEGYEMVDEYRDDIGHSIVYQKENDETAVFVLDYHLRQEGEIYEVLFDKGKYQTSQVIVNGQSGDLYLSLDNTETNQLVWIDDERGIIFSLNGFLNQQDIMHIADGLFLCKTPK